MLRPEQENSRFIVTRALSLANATLAEMKKTLHRKKHRTLYYNKDYTERVSEHIRTVDSFIRI